MSKISFNVFDDDYFRFRRWLKARDRKADITVEPADDGLWRVTAKVSKRYLVATISRRWSAA